MDRCPYCGAPSEVVYEAEDHAGLECVNPDCKTQWASNRDPEAEEADAWEREQDGDEFAQGVRRWNYEARHGIGMSG